MRDTHWPGRASGPPGGTKSHLPGGLGQELTMLARAPPPAPGPLRNLLRAVGGSGLGEPSSGTWGVVLSPYQIDSEEAEGEGDTRCHPGLATGHL